MIQIQIQGGPALDRALTLAGKATSEEISHELRAFLVNGTSDFQRKNMRARDDRNRGDFLMRRPRTSLGVRHATGSLIRAMYNRTTQAQTLDAIYAETGFLSSKAARIARIHELGTIRYGGTEPDIVPRRGKYLKARIFNGTAARGVKGARFAFLKKVGIPPRLGWFAWWTSERTRKNLEVRIGKAARRALATVTPRA